MKIFKIIIIFVFLFLVGCRNNSKVHDIVINNHAVEFSVFPKSENISFENVTDYNMGEPRSIHVLDSTLIIANSNRNTEFFFYKYSLGENEFSKGFLRRARGPGEALGVSTTGVNNGKLWAYDITLKKMLINNLDSLSDENVSQFDEYFVDDLYFKVSLVDSLKMLAVNLNKSNSKVDRVDLESKIKLNDFGEYYYIPNGLPIESVKDAYASEIFARPSGEKVVLAYNFTDAIEIFDLKDNSSIVIKGPDNFDVDFTVENKNDYYYMGSTKDTRKSYINGDVTDEYIYLVYSGYIREDRSVESKFKWEHAMFILIYDWNGNPIKKLVLDRYIKTIGISEDNKTIYSYDVNVGNIIKSKLNGL